MGADHQTAVNIGLAMKEKYLKLGNVTESVWCSHWSMITLPLSGNEPISQLYPELARECHRTSGCAMCSRSLHKHFSGHRHHTHASTFCARWQTFTNVKVHYTG